MSDADSRKHGPSERKRPVLFSHGDTGYLRLRKLTNGPGEQKRFLGLPRTGDKDGPLVEVAMVGASADWTSHARLEDAAALGVLLSHPAIPRTHGLFQHQGARYLVTEYVSGISLNMAGHYGCVRGRQLSEAFTLYVASVVADVLSYVHTLTDAAGRPLGVIHRAVDPYNIIVKHDGTVMLANFMSACSLLPGRAPVIPFIVQGEIDFAAPERLWPTPEGGVDARSDLFSLGMVMLEMITGLQLYGSDEVEQAAAKLPPGHPGYDGEVPWVSEVRSWTTVEQMARRAAAFRSEHIDHLMRKVSGPVRLIIHKLLRRGPSERYATAAALKGDLDACLGVLDRPYGAREAMEELLKARSEAMEVKEPIELIPSDEAERRAGELHQPTSH
ncbi:serine/threonine-protein kinase [Archangium gephyra]|uniref:non-specific serine/threonine protein kinase n=1 Tax=Archangium gephyra TaxID=48 RepID=A0AAC8TDD4_9BACT|nr:protein kinase [Archangium gephyra]AKJ01845.1 serine/threonine protein kinase [Archangium gephyra]REG34652.1 serine/threonine-protein kinase [Archangium gephyra]